MPLILHKKKTRMSISEEWFCWLFWGKIALELLKGRLSVLIMLLRHLIGFFFLLSFLALNIDKAASESMQVNHAAHTKGFLIEFASSMSFTQGKGMRVQS